jgi:hypothetical protein
MVSQHGQKLNTKCPQTISFVKGTKMRKLIFIIIAFLLVAAVLIPAYADIGTPQWIGPTYKGTDTYYGDGNVTAYEEGATAVLAVPVSESNVTTGFNVTNVYVSFDWGSTYYSTQVSAASPFSLKYEQSQVFFINFTVPQTTTASNLYRHSYTIYATYKMKNAANASQILSSKYSSSLYDDFVIYSTDQASAMDLLRIINSFRAPAWESAQARILSYMAMNETSSGERYYAEGNFTLAKESYSTALSDLNTALSDEQSYQSMLQDLQAGNMSARNAYLNAWASFLNGFSTLWVLLGIGWVLISIGYIVKVMRTRRPEAPAPAPA